MYRTSFLHKRARVALAELWRRSARMASAVVLIWIAAGDAGYAEADQADDLQAMIDRARRGVDDLRALDRRHAATEDIAVLDVWLGEAWNLRSEKDYQRSRAVLDRVEAQKDMIRERITASDLSAKASGLEADVEAAYERIEALKTAIKEATARKAALEATLK